MVAGDSCEDLYEDSLATNCQFLLEVISFPPAAPLTEKSAAGAGPGVSSQAASWLADGGETLCGDLPDWL